MTPQLSVTTRLTLDDDQSTFDISDAPAMSEGDVDCVLVRINDDLRLLLTDEEALALSDILRAAAQNR